MPDIADSRLLLPLADESEPAVKPDDVVAEEPQPWMATEDVTPGDHSAGADAVRPITDESEPAVKPHDDVVVEEPQPKMATEDVTPGDHKPDDVAAEEPQPWMATEDVTPGDRSAGADAVPPITDESEAAVKPHDDVVVEEPPPEMATEDVTPGDHSDGAGAVPPITAESEHAVKLDDDVVTAEPQLLPVDAAAMRNDHRDVDLEQSAGALSRYRPPSQRPSSANRRRTRTSETRRKESTWLQLDVAVHITFDRYGFCTVQLLPARTQELGEALLVRYAHGSLELVAQERWYQDLAFDNIALYLRDGIELRAHLESRQFARWTLKGRDIYVLASHPDATGFVSTSRLVLGRSHLVMCIDGQVEQVQNLLHDAGCNNYTRVDQSSGAPEGWVLFRDVTPTQAIALGGGVDPHYALKPAPDLEIELEGGIRIRNSEWLVGYPPHIRLFGQVDGSEKVLVDGVQAQHSPDGTLFAPGYDLPGQHSVICEGLSRSRSYSIEDAPHSWETWPAYRFDGADICGPLVLPGANVSFRKMISVPMSNPLLIGAIPGQVFRCTARHVGIWKGVVPFQPVWALPAQPLTCKKATARILQLTQVPVQHKTNPGRAELNWCDVVLDAARKGLHIESGFADSIAAWATYKDVARRIRKKARR